MPAPGNLAIVDPVLTNLAIDWATKHTYAGTKLFPIVNCSSFTGQYVVFDNALKLHTPDAVMEVAYDAITPKIDFDLSQHTFTLKEYGIGTKITVKEKTIAQNYNNIIKLEQRKANLIGEAMTLGLEKRIADYAQNPANYAGGNTQQLDNTPGNIKWDNWVGLPDPLGDLTAACEQLRSVIGVYPNIIIMAANAAQAMAQNAAVRSLYYGTGYTTMPPLRGQQALEIVAKFLGIPEWQVGSDTYVAAIGGAFLDVWDETCVLAYKDISLTPEAPTFGVTLRKQGDPSVIRWTSPEHNNTEFIDGRDASLIHRVWQGAGFLIWDILT